MTNPAIPRDEVHRWSEEAGEEGEDFRGTATRLLRTQKRLLSFYNKNLPATDGQTGQVATYLMAVVVRVFDRAGGRLDKVNGRQINQAAAKVNAVVEGLLPFDEGFPERLRTIDERAQPHILDEAL